MAKKAAEKKRESESAEDRVAALEERVASLEQHCSRQGYTPPAAREEDE